MARIFTDEELTDLWSRGLSDCKIARIFGVTQRAVWIRRIKLNLPANFRPFGNKRNLTSEERIQRWEQHLKNTKKRAMERWKDGKFREYFKKYWSSYYKKRWKEDPIFRRKMTLKTRIWREKNPEWLREYSLAYYHKKMQDPKFREKLRKHRKEYYHKKMQDPKFREKLRKYYREYMREKLKDKNYAEKHRKWSREYLQKKFNRTPPIEIKGLFKTKFKCPFCEKTSDNKYVITGHMQVHK